jgi:tRNA(adenine34) deaminase
MLDMEQHERFMVAALEEARRALDRDEVPVGAVVVRDGRIIGRGHNQREVLADPTAHAEMLAITAAASALGDWRLTGCTLYVTLEPCPMCAGAIVLARLPRVVFGAMDPKLGACGSLYSIPTDTRTNHQVELLSGVCTDESKSLLQEFFRRQRAAGKK